MTYVDNAQPTTGTATDWDQEVMAPAKAIFWDIPMVTQAATAVELFEVLDALWIELLRGTVRPGSWEERVKNYSLAANAHFELLNAIEWRDAPRGYFPLAR